MARSVPCEAQGLVGGDVDFGVFGGVVAVVGFDDAHAAFGEGFGEFFPRLFTESMSQKRVSASL